MEVEEVFFNTSDYKLVENKFDEGSYGPIYIVENITNKQRYVAKVINVGKNFDGREQILFLRESLILHSLNHPAIAKFIGINFKSFSNPDLLQPTIITEFLTNKSLIDLLKNEKLAISNVEWTATKKYINLLGISHAL